MFFPKTALKAFVLLSLLASGDAQKKKEKKKGNEPESDQTEYMVYYGNVDQDVSEITNIVIAQSSSVSIQSVHQHSQLAEISAGNKKDLYDFVQSLKAENPDVIVEVNSPMYASGWADKKTPMVRARMLAEDTPYGIGMVQADQLEMNPDNPMKICVVDTGYELGHEDLPFVGVDGFSPSSYGANEKWDEDGHGHGSHCAGTIGAIGDNSVGVVGVNKDPERFTFYIGKGLTNSGSGSSAGVMEAVSECVANGADVVSLSLGGGGFSQASFNQYKNYYNSNVLFVAAAGNGGSSAFSYPASYPFLMSVAAVDTNRNRAGFSQYNDQVEIAAPGVGVKSTINNGEYASWSGTSMACPHVAGVAAKVWSWFPDCQNNQIRNVLLKTADRQGRDCTDEYGFGIVQAKAAFDLLTAEGCEAGGEAEAEGSQSSLSIGGCAQTSTGPTSSPTPPIPCEGKEVTVELTTDTYGAETTWHLKDNTGNTLGVGSDYVGNEFYTEDVCVPDTNVGCLTFTIEDSYGDGICCDYGDGSYEVFWDGASVASGASFGASESEDFACNEPSPTAPEPTAPNPEPTAPAPEPTAPAPEPTVEDTLFPSSIAPTVSTEAPAPASDDESSNFPSSIVPTVATEAPAPASDDESSNFPSSIVPTVATDAPVATDDTATPSSNPSAAPSNVPSVVPSSLPSSSPSDMPSNTPSAAPSDVPSSDEPTATPTDEPTADTGDLPTMSIFKHKVIVQNKGSTQYVGKLKVWVRDEDNAKTAGVKVSVRCTKDNGQTKIVTKNTNSKGIAALSCYKVNINQSITLSEMVMTKEDMSYDMNGNSKENGCPIFSDGCPDMVISK